MMAGTVMRLLFGYDIFIAYARSDGTVYAARLAEELTALGYSCVLDLNLSVPGGATPSHLLRAVRMSRVLIVVATRGALISSAVGEEIEAFRRSHQGGLLLITFDELPDRAIWYDSVQGLAYLRERNEHLVDAPPSTNVLGQIRASLSFLQRSAARRRAFLAGLIGAVFLLAGVALLAFPPLSDGPWPNPRPSTGPGWARESLLLLVAFFGGTLVTSVWKGRGNAARSDEARKLVATVEQAGKAAFLESFISYSHADKDFAIALQRALQKTGIGCWLDEKDLKPGDDIQEAVQKAIAKYDRFLLCCSKKSLTSWWVDNELGMAFHREETLSRTQGSAVRIVIPLNLDNALFADGWSSGYRSQLLRRKAVDFTGSHSKRHMQQEEIDKLVSALRSDA